MYQRLLGEVSDLRQGNRRRIRKGLWALVGVTVGLLALVFISQGSKVIFLLLWIVSMFGVAAYLIGVEYMDYQMQHKVGHIANMREGELNEILTLPESSPKFRLAARLRREADALEGVETPPEPEESIPAVFDLPRSLVDLEPLEDPEPEQPEKKSGSGLLAVVALLVLGGGGAFAYVKFIKPNRSGVKVSADPDEYDFPDEEYINEDEPAEAETEAEHE